MNYIEQANHDNHLAENDSPHQYEPEPAEKPASPVLVGYYSDHSASSEYDGAVLCTRCAAKPYFAHLSFDTACNDGSICGCCGANRYYEWRKQW